MKMVTTKGETQQVTKENFRIFFHVLEEDHSLPDLIWNQQTRLELKNIIEVELKSFAKETGANGGIGKIVWNHQQFTVLYPSLKNEVKVGTIYEALATDRRLLHQILERPSSST
jgi:hypothetical protein